MLDVLTIKVVLQPNTVEAQLIATKRRLIFQWRKSVVFCFLVDILEIKITVPRQSSRRLDEAARSTGTALAPRRQPSLTRGCGIGDDKELLVCSFFHDPIAHLC